MILDPRSGHCGKACVSFRSRHSGLDMELRKFQVAKEGLYRANRSYC
jgi:hypothetical protein